MTIDHCRVTFQPTERSVSVLAGTSILETAAAAGLVIGTPCGGAGTCGKCRVQITQGAGEPTAHDRSAFSEDELREGWRLACQNAVSMDTVIHMPSASLFGHRHQISSDSAVDGGPTDLLPDTRKVYVELTPPTLEDNRPDLLRLEEQTGPFRTDLAMLRRVPVRLRLNEFKGTAVLSDHTLVDFEDGDTSDQCFGVAFDLGTTTIAASLVSLCTGQELAVTSRMNPQVSCGDDVLARISHASLGPGSLDELRHVVIEEASNMIWALCAEAHVNPNHIYEVAFAGNTTMQHLLCGVDPSQLGQVPFAPAYGRGLLLSSRDLCVPVNPRGIVYVFPVIGGFVGGDTVAGVLATQLDSLPGPALMVDVGTNGEIVLAHDGTLRAASTAAGPAFEGARISCGMRGRQGAVEKVVLDGEVRLGVIGNTRPVGLCGSGLIDLMAELLTAGLASPEGALCGPDDIPVGLHPALAERVELDTNGQPAFTLVSLSDSGANRSIQLTQRDVRELQLGCGAIRAGISLMLKDAGISAADLKTVLVAGGFGSFIRRDKAQRIGLIPPEVDHERISFVGNVSLAGARWSLLSANARRHGEDLARRAVHVELSTNPAFQMEFAEAMIFPEA